MFNCVKKSESIRSFHVINNEVLKVTDDFNLFHNDIFIAAKVLDSGYTILKDTIVYLSNEFTAIERDVLENVFFVPGSEDSDSETIILSGDFRLNYPDFSNNYYFYDTKTKTKILLFEFSNLYLFYRHKSIIVLSDKMFIKVFNISTPTPLWQFDLQQLGTFSNGSERAFPYEVERFLGVMGELLFVKVSNNQILVLHSQTGELVKRLSTIDERRGESSILFDLSENFFFRMNYHFVPEKQIIYGLFYDTLYEIQCHDAIYTITHGLKNEFLAKGIQNPHAISSKSVLFENQLYFMEQEQGRFGILDIASREIIFLSDPIDITGKPQSIDKLKEIQVAPNKVYVLTHDHTLHIFEKENGL